jgi:hypothetical protein
MRISPLRASPFGMNGMSPYSLTGPGLWRTHGNTTTSTCRVICNNCGRLFTLGSSSIYCQGRRSSFGSVPIILTPKFYSNVMMFQSVQRITEWRGTFGSGAIAALKNILASKGIRSPEGRKKYALHMLSKGLPFTWGSFNSRQKVRRLIEVICVD